MSAESARLEMIERIRRRCERTDEAAPPPPEPPWLALWDPFHLYRRVHQKPRTLRQDSEPPARDAAGARLRMLERRLARSRGSAPPQQLPQANRSIGTYREDEEDRH